LHLPTKKPLAKLPQFHLLFTTARPQVEIPNKFNMAVPEDEQKLLDVMTDLQDSTQYYLNYITFSALNVLVCFIRFFKFMGVQVRKTPT
jgi:hypothetical protein